MKYSLELKSTLLRNGIFEEYMNALREHYNGNNELCQEFGMKYNELIFGACKSLNDSKKHKRKRLMDRFTPLIWSGELIFVTLTFKDEVLGNTNEDTRRRYVTRYLKSDCRTYVGNIDYGSRNDREHYHALVLPWNLKQGLDLTKWHHLGGLKVERVRPTMKDIEKTSKYLAKLSNHALKDTGRMPKLIWSRGLLF